MNDSVNEILVIIEIRIVGPTDDDPPSFGQNEYTFSIREDDVDGTEIGDVEASDDGEWTVRECVLISPAEGERGGERGNMGGKGRGEHG